jgi:hypothetical protein
MTARATAFDRRTKFRPGTHIKRDEILVADRMMVTLMPLHAICLYALFFMLFARIFGY